jgi:hypothetical protein
MKNNFEPFLHLRLSSIFPFLPKIQLEGMWLRKPEAYQVLPPRVLNCPCSDKFSWPNGWNTCLYLSYVLKMRISGAWGSMRSGPPPPGIRVGEPHSHSSPVTLHPLRFRKHHLFMWAGSVATCIEHMLLNSPYPYTVPVCSCPRDTRTELGNSEWGDEGQASSQPRQETTLDSLTLTVTVQWILLVIYPTSNHPTAI